MNVVSDPNEKFSVLMSDPATLTILLPTTHAAKEMLREMKTGYEAKVQFLDPRDTFNCYYGMTDVGKLLEVVFKDGTPSPYSISFTRAELKGALPVTGDLERIKIAQKKDPGSPLLILPASTDIRYGRDEDGGETITSNSITIVDVYYS